MTDTIVKAVLKIASVAQFDVRRGGFTKELSLLNNSLVPMSNHVQHCMKRQSVFLVQFLQEKIIY